MKRIAALLLSVACLGTLLAGCGSTAEEPSAQGQESSALTGKVTTGGSTSMEKVIDVLQETFMEEHPDVDVTYDPTGSGAGITGTQEGSLDIGLSSRALKDGETGVVAVTIALDGIAVIVNPENPVADLTMKQIAAIATGEITDWAEVGGTAGEIVMLGREAGSGTRDGFESIVGVSDACVYAQELTATGAVIAAVQSNPNAIGYASLSALDDTVKAVTVEGISCTEQTIQDGTYLIQRPFNFILKDGAQLSAAADAFLSFATSPEAASLISAAGAIPLT